MNRIKTKLSHYKTIVLCLVASIMSLNNLPVNAETVKSLDQITSAIQNPEMRQRWETAHKEGKLPPINTLPVPAQPVTKRKFSKLAVADIKINRPVIAKTVPIDIQLFSTDSKINRYRGDFQLTAIRDGVLVGKTAASKADVELIYKLPNSNLSQKSLDSTTLYLDYFDDIKDSALQRRIILYNKTDKTPQIISISEGSNKPYQKNIRELGLSIKQNVNSKIEDSPTVTVSYRGKNIILAEGEQKSLKTTKETLHIHLLSSYAYSKKYGLLQEGQAYYVNLIIYK